MRKKVSIKTIVLIIGGLFLLMGLVFDVVAVSVTVSNNEFMKNAESTDAEIVEIKREYYRTNRGKRKTSHEVWVEYEVDGKYYEGELNYYSSGMREGQTIEVFYDIDDPSDIRMKSNIIGIVFGIIGGIFTALGAAALIVSIKIGSKVKKLKANGDTLSGTITNAYVNPNVSINGRHPFKLECQVIEPFSGETYLYSSGNINQDVSHLMGETVTVYVDKNDKSKYYVDTDELLNRYNMENKIFDFR